ncbi:hypothetical protein [Streptomyces sp. NPDC002346]
MNTSPRTVMRIYFHLHKPDEELYEQLLALLEGITPRVQFHPAEWSADIDLTGALRYWKRDAKGLAAVIRLRALALYGIQSSAGLGPSRMVATMAAALSPPGSVTAVGDSPYDIAAFLRSQRVAALPGIGPAAARSLSRYGINSIGEDGFLLELKSDPGRLGLETLLEEIVKLRRAKGVGPVGQRARRGVGQAGGLVAGSGDGLASVGSGGEPAAGQVCRHSKDAARPVQACGPCTRGRRRPQGSAAVCTRLSGCVS